MIYKILKEGIEVDKAKIEAIEKLPPPISVKGIRRFGVVHVNVGFLHHPRARVVYVYTGVRICLMISHSSDILIYRLLPRYYVSWTKLAFQNLPKSRYPFSYRNQRKKSTQLYQFISAPFKHFT